MENQYNDKHAREILKPYAPAKYLSFDDSGVWPGDALKTPDEHDEFESRAEPIPAEIEYLRWRPAENLTHLPGATEPESTPMLPNPFNARELAAFMLEGTGALVRDAYGEWADGPSQQSLNHIKRASFGRRAVIEAFAAYRLAIEKVGQWDADALARRDAAHKACENSSNDKALLKAFDDAQAQWDTAYQAWLTKMVCCLLEPQAAAPAPLVADSASNAPVASQEQRQAHRWQLCIDAGLTMPTDTYSHLPRGIGKVAKGLDVKSHVIISPPVAGLSFAQEKC